MLGTGSALASSQAVAGAGNLTLDGSATSGGTASFSTGQRVSISSAGDDRGIAFTVTGTDMFGRAQTETITGANVGASTGSKYFSTITQIAASGAAAGNVDVGTADERIAGNVTQSGYIGSIPTIKGVVDGSVTLLSTDNQFAAIDDFTAGGDFSVRSRPGTLTVSGDVVSSAGNISIENYYYDLTVDSAGSVTAAGSDKGVILRASANQWDYTANIQGAVSAGTGGINLSSSHGYVSTSGAGTLTTTGGVTIASAPNYGSGRSNDYSTTINAAVSAGASGIAINSAGTFSNNSSGTLTTPGGVSIKTYWDGTYSRNLTLGGNVTAGVNGIKLTSSGTINQTGGILSTPGTLLGPDQSGGSSPSATYPSARGAVTLNNDNLVANLGPFYLYNTSQSAFSFNDASGGLTLAGTIENSHGSVTINTKGGVLDLMGYDVYAGGMATGGAAVSLTGRGINQSFGSEINTTGGTTGNPRTGSNGGGTITLTGHDGTASGAIVLAGGISTVNTSTSAIKIRGTSDLQLPNISAVNGSLVLGDDTATIGLVTGNITQATSTALDIKTLQLGTATNAIGGSAVLANTGNKIVELGIINTGAHKFTDPDTDIQYDMDIYDSTGGLTLTQNVISAEGLRIRTTDSTSGILAFGANSILASGDIYLSGKTVTQADGSVINADNSGAGGTGGSIRIDGGGGTNNITLGGVVTTDNASGTAIEVVNATNATLNMISATAGTLALGVDTKELTGTVSQVDSNSSISATTLKGDAGIVTVNKSNIDNLGTFTTTGTMTLKDQGGAGTAGLKFTGTVTTADTAWIETSDGILDLDTQTLNATGKAVTLKGVALSQQATSKILSTTADLYGGAGNIDLFSTTNDFTGQVTVHSTGTQVSLQDANQLSMNALTGVLDPATSIKLWAGNDLALTTENITTTSGNIEFKSLGSILNTPGKLTTGSGNIALYSLTTLSLAEKIKSTSGNITIDGATIASRAGAEDYIETGGAGYIDITARSGNFTQGSDVVYKTVGGDITLTAMGGNATLANIQSTTGGLNVTAGGNILQLSGSGDNC